MPLLAGRLVKVTVQLSLENSKVCVQIKKTIRPANSGILFASQIRDQTVKTSNQKCLSIIQSLR